MKRLLVLLAPLVALVACEPPHPTGEAVVIGDSILTLSADEVAETLPTGGWQPYVESRNGTGLAIPVESPDWYPWAFRAGELVGQRVPDALVVILGTNDTLHMPQRGPYAQHIDRLMTKVEDVPGDPPRVLWFNVSTHTAVLGRNTGAAQINVELLIATERWPNLEIVDWDREVADGNLYCPADTVHPDDCGAQATADLMLRELRDPASSG